MSSNANGRGPNRSEIKQSCPTVLTGAKNPRIVPKIQKQKARTQFSLPEEKSSPVVIVGPLIAASGGGAPPYRPCKSAPPPPDAGKPPPEPRKRGTGDRTIAPKPDPGSGCAPGPASGISTSGPAAAPKIPVKAAGSKFSPARLPLLPLPLPLSNHSNGHRHHHHHGSGTPNKTATGRAAPMASILSPSRTLTGVESPPRPPVWWSPAHRCDVLALSVARAQRLVSPFFHLSFFEFLQISVSDCFVLRSLCFSFSAVEFFCWRVGLWDQ